MTNDDYNFLRLYSNTFSKAYLQSYARTLPRSVNERLAGIMGDKVNFGCGGCVMNLYRRLYLALKAEEERRAVCNEPEPTEPEVPQEPIKEKKATDKPKKAPKTIKTRIDKKTKNKKIKN